MKYFIESEIFNLSGRKSQIRRLHQHKLHKKSLFLIGLKNDRHSDVDDGKCSLIHP